MDIAKQLEEIVGKENVLVSEPMSKHTTFRTGGNADYFVTPKSKDELIEILKLNEAVTVIGNGSNLLVKDGGIRGIVVRTTGLTNIEIIDNIIISEAGVMLPKVSNFAKDNSLSGLEFACGIPGTVGGAVLMNAGAYGGEMANVVIETTYCDKKGNTFVTNDHQFGYRKSMFSDKDYIILETKMRLNLGNKDEISEMMKDFNNRRREKQPIDKPSAGSTFKRPEGYFVGKLIDDCGLRGFKLGNAKVSDLHAGFIINDGGATSSEILELIKYVQNAVFEKFGVTLETEVKIIGE